MADYLTFSGFVQFDVKARDTEAGGLREATIRMANNPNGTLLTVTLWDNAFGDVEIERGDYLAADGKYSPRVVPNADTGESRTFHNLTATQVFVQKPTKVQPKKGEGERQTSNKGGAPKERVF